MKGLAKDDKSEQENLLASILEIDLYLKKLEKEITSLQKEQKSITKSKVWKITKPVRAVKKVPTSFLSKLVTSKSKLIEENKQLATEVNLLQDEVIQLDQVLQQVTLENEKLSLKIVGDDNKSAHFLTNIKEAKKNGTFINYIQAISEVKNTQQEIYKKMLHYAGRLFQKESSEYKRLVFNQVLSSLSIEEIPEFIVRETEHTNEVALHKASSFTANLAIRARKRQLGAELPEWQLDNKRKAYELIDALKVKRPWFSEQVYTIQELPLKDGTVIKPVHGAGSRGVYLVYSENKILDVKRTKTLTSWAELKESMSEDLSSNAVFQDVWMIEELLLENKEAGTPARDLKFYCFYGKVGLILEVQRFPEVQYCWWTEDGERTSIGKYENDLFKGTGVSTEEVQFVQSLSNEIPTPFVRIDFLKTENGLIFGEFTPKPGNYDEINKKTDCLLGDYFLQAESRLADDLLNGKKFTHYRKVFS